MRRIALLLCLACLLAASTAVAQARQLVQVPMLPLAEGEHPDLEALLTLHWKEYWRRSGPDGFGPGEMRAGRVDLDGDGDPELILMIDKPAWLSEYGKPLVIATWVDHHWLPVGWGWGEEDNVFVLDEVVEGWRTVETGKFLMRWTKKGYQRNARD